MGVNEKSNYTVRDLTHNLTLETSTETMNRISTLAHTMNVIISVLTIVGNSIVLKCLITDRKKFSEMIFNQILCLCVTDIIAGLFPATSILVLFDGINRRRKWCSLLLGLPTLSQFAVLLNLCSLSTRRWIVLRKASMPSATTRQCSKSDVILLIVTPWLISGILLSPSLWLPFLEDTFVNGCLSQNVPEQNFLVVFYAINAGSLILLLAVSIGSIVVLNRLKTVNGNAFQNRRVQQHQRAKQLLIVALFVAFVTSLPSILMVVLAVRKVFKDFQIAYICSRLRMLNSMLNPVVYSIQISEMRIAIKKNLELFLEGIRTVFIRERAREPSIEYQLQTISI